MATRKPGWYWVKAEGQWIPWEWIAKSEVVCARWADGAGTWIEEIGEKVVEQEEFEELSGLLETCYGRIGFLSIEKEHLLQEALDLAKDVNWFVRMQGSPDLGMKQTIEKAQDFIRKHGDGET